MLDCSDYPLAFEDLRYCDAGGQQYRERKRPSNSTARGTFSSRLESHHRGTY